MGLGNRAINAGSLGPGRQNKTKNGKYTLDYFQVQPTAILNDGCSLPTGATGAVSILRTSNGFSGGVYEHNVLGAGQTIKVPAQDATTGYLDISQDQTNNEGCELVPGGSTINGKHAYTIGTDQPFFVRCKFSIEDASGTDEMLVGFRKVQAYQTAHGSYTDYAALGIITSAANAAVKVCTNLNNGGEVATDTTQTWVDAATHEWRVEVDGSGNAKFFIDGATPTVTNTFTFDSTDVVIPFIFFLHAADVAGKVLVSEFECGYLPQAAV